MSRYKVIVSLIAIVATFAVQVVMLSLESEADSLLVVPWWVCQFS